MTRPEIVRELLSEYEKRRQENRSEQEARIADVCRRDPAIARLREESTQLAFSTMRQILSASGDAKNIAEAMKQRGLAINQEIRSRLGALGLPKDYLDERYQCAACQDTGYIGDAPARPCACLEARIRERMVQDMTQAGFSAQRFECFDEQFVPEEGGQRRQIMAVRDACRDYIEQYPHYPYRNLLLTGAGGLGKTFLLNCVYARALEKGVGALRVTAFRMLEAMRKRHMGADSEDDQDFNAMLETPLLFLDDLGTEPMLRNITVEYLFALLNERMAAERHTMIATNLTPLQLQERYGERVSSRLLDRTNCAVMQLKGKDLRRI